MFMKTNIKLLLLCAIMSFSNPIMAQNSGDRLYSQGLELQKRQTVQAQKSAIAKFQSFFNPSFLTGNHHLLIISNPDKGI